MTRLRPWLLSIALVSSACGTPPPVRSAGTNGPGQAGSRPPSARVRAAEARTEAARQEVRPSAVVTDVQLRLQGLSTEEGSNRRVAARLRFANPWFAGTERGARNAVFEAERARLRQASLEERVRTCRMTAAAEVARVERAQWTRRSVQVEGIGSWTGDWEQAAQLDGLQAARAQLWLSRVRAGVPMAMQGAEPPEVSPLYALPGLSERLPTSSAVDGDAVRKAIQEHPQWARRLARAERFSELARVERRTALPSIDFVEAGYSTNPDRTGADAWDVRLALVVPLDGETVRRRKSYEARARAEQLDGEAVSEELLRMARRAQASLADFSQRQPALRSLLERAGSANQQVDSWIAERRGSPLDVIRVLGDVLAAEREVLRAQRIAAEAGCELLAATAVDLRAWPTQSTEPAEPAEPAGSTVAAPHSASSDESQQRQGE